MRRETAVITSVLKDELGFLWLPVLIKSALKKNRLLKDTKWSHDRSAEGKFARRLSILAALYMILKERYDQGTAFRILGRIIVPVGCCEQWQNLRGLNVGDRRGYERLKAFYNFMGEGGSGQFVKRRLSSDTEGLVQYEVRECLFARFFKEMGMLEVASLFCKIDRSFFPTAIPDYSFSRGDSWENSAAYGKDHCVFRFEKMKEPFDEAYIGETNLLNYTEPEIQLLYEQLDLSYKSDGEKIGQFYEYVKSQIRTDDLSKEPRPASVVQKRGRGSNHDKTVLFMALLRASGIPCRAHFVEEGGRAEAFTEVMLNGRWLKVRWWTDGKKGSGVFDSVWLDDISVEKSEKDSGDLGVFSAPEDFYNRASGRLQSQR